LDEKRVAPISFFEALPMAIDPVAPEHEQFREVAVSGICVA